MNRIQDLSEISDSLPYTDVDDSKIRNLEAQVQQKIDNINKLEQKLKKHEITKTEEMVFKSKGISKPTTADLRNNNKRKSEMLPPLNFHH